MDLFEVTFERARRLGVANHPDAPTEHHITFGNLVAISVTGLNTGISEDPPSMREYYGISLLINSHYIMGEIGFSEAVRFFDEIAYGRLTSEMIACSKDLPCANDSEADIVIATLQEIIEFCLVEF